jgi:hypothetical protein
VGIDKVSFTLTFQEDSETGFHAYSSIRHKWERQFVSFTLWPHFMLMEIPSEILTLDGEYTPASAYRRGFGGFNPPSEVSKF